MGVHTQQMVTVGAMLVLSGVFAMARPSGPEVLRETRTANGFKAEHRAVPEETQLLNLPYYGGAEGNVLVYHPTLGLAPALLPRPAHKASGWRAGEEEQILEEHEDPNGGGGGGGGGDGGGAGGGDGGGDGGDSEGVVISQPPPGSSIAEVRPVGLSIAGIGGVAASKPIGTAVVGPGGLAIARPIATAIAGVPPDAVLGPTLGGPPSSGSSVPSDNSDMSAEMRDGKISYKPLMVAVGPNKDQGSKYSLVPVSRSLPINSMRYFRIQPQPALNNLDYSQQPVVLYPIAYY